MRAWANEEKGRHRPQLHAHLHSSHRKNVFSDDEDEVDPPRSVTPPPPNDVRLRMSLSPTARPRDEPMSKRRKLPDIPLKRRRTYNSPTPQPRDARRPRRQSSERRESLHVDIQSPRRSRTESSRTIQILELRHRPPDPALGLLPTSYRRSSPSARRIVSPLQVPRRNRSPSPPRRVTSVGTAHRRAPSFEGRVPSEKTPPPVEESTGDFPSSSTSRVEAQSPAAPEPAAELPPATSASQCMSDFIESRRRELAGRGAAELIFPEIGGVGPLAVSVNNAHGRSVGTVMVAFERKSLEILRHRLGVTEDDIRERLPKVIQARKVDRNLQPWFLHKELPIEEFSWDFQQYRDTKLVPYLHRLLGTIYTAQNQVKVKQQAFSTEKPNSGEFKELYPAEIVRFYLDEQKVQANHPLRYQALNRTFDFITRSLLWCLRSVRPNSVQRKFKGGSSSQTNAGTVMEPRDRSIELNADVMNVWLALLQEWSAQLSQVLAASTPPVKEEKKQVKEEPAEQQSNTESSPDQSAEARFPRVLYLSTDFMTAFEHALAPRLTPELLQASEDRRSEDAGDAMRCGPVLDAASRARLELWAVGLRAHQGFESACERVFRFFRRRGLDPWQWDFVCWPVNYISAHWVLLTMNMKTQELIWSDSYRNCYTEACADSLRVKSHAKGHQRQRRAEATEAVRELFGDREESDEEEGARDESSSESAPPPESLAALSPIFDLEATKWNGWLHFWCVEAYMKFDLRKRRNDCLSEEEKSILAKVWPRACVEGLPQQSKLSLDCGVFVAHFARNIAQFGQPDLVDFGAEDISHFRDAMSVLIGRGGLPTCPQEMAANPEESADGLTEKQGEPK